MAPSDLPPRPPTVPSPARILVRGVNWVGDAVMTTPALMRLREAHPQAQITLLTREKLAELWQPHPAVDAVLTLAPHDSLRQVARRLREGRFAWGLALPNSPRSALELWLAGIPERIGYAAGVRRWLFTRPVPLPPCTVRMHKRSRRDIRRVLRAPAGTPLHRWPPAAHQIHHYLQLVAACGANPQPLTPTLTVTAEELETARRRFHLAPEHRWVGLNAGAEYGPAKRWPADRFAAAALELQRQTGCRWLILGGPRDGAVATQIDAAIRAALGRQTDDVESAMAPANLAGQTTLRELCAVLKLCRLLLTNDTGPMHLAAAVGTPVVVPFGSTAPELTGPGLPGGSPHRVLRTGVACAPCFRRHCPIDLRCLRGISVAEVVAAAAPLLSRRREKA
jgi:heptosyltransferase-2